MKQKNESQYKDNGYEVCLRRIMCIFLSVETLLIYAIASSWRFLPEEELFYIHTESFFNMIGAPMLWMLIPVVMTALSLFFKSFYYIYEILHIIIGTFIALELLSLLIIAIIVFLLFSGRMIIYSHCMRRHSKKLKNNVGF